MIMSFVMRIIASYKIVDPMWWYKSITVWAGGHEKVAYLQYPIHITTFSAARRW